MKKFKFRLQRVLEYRHTLTKEKERELMQRNFELRQQEERVVQIMAEQEAMELAGETPVMTMAELSSRGDYLESLQQALVQQRLAVIEATDAVEKAREAYVQKALEEETLVKLKEKKQLQYKEDLHRHERKIMDTNVVQRHRFTKKDLGQGE